MRRTPALLLLVALLAGCSGLPTSEEVSTGLAVEAPQAPDFEYVPPGPEPGDGPEAVIRGFLRAGRASDGTYDIARRFTAADVGVAWQPDSAIVVHEATKPLGIRALGGGHYRIEAPVVMTLDSSGRSTPAVPGATGRADVTVARIGGQWRITAVPKGFGRWVSSADFTRLFVPETLHYLNHDGTSLVPDQRWFPRDHLPTRLATAQLDEPPAYLGSAVRTAVPPGARLATPAVTVVDGTAVVDIASVDMATETRARRELWAQLATTLTQVPEVNGVLVQNDGATLDFAGRPDGGLTPADLGLSVVNQALSVSPVIRNGAKVTQLDSQRIREDIGVRTDRLARRTYPDVPTSFRRLALSADGVEVAAVESTGRHVSRWRNGNQYEVPVNAKDVSRPAYDGLGFLWFGGTGSTEGRVTNLWTVDTAVDPASAELAAARRVDAPWLLDRRIVSVKVSAGGERAVVASTDASGRDPRVELSGVIRDKEGRPVALAAPLRLAPTLVRVVDVAWLGPVTLVALGQVRGDPLRPWVVTTSGEMRPLTASPDAVAVSTLASERDTVVVAAVGDVRIRGGSRWISLAKGTDFAAAGL